MKRISLLVDQETYDALNELLNEQGITNRSAFFRKALVSHINNTKEYQNILKELRSIKTLLLENPVRDSLKEAIPTNKPAPKDKLKNKRSAAIAAFANIGEDIDD